MIGTSYRRALPVGGSVVAERSTARLFLAYAFSVRIRFYFELCAAFASCSSYAGFHSMLYVLKSAVLLIYMSPLPFRPGSSTGTT